MDEIALTLNVLTNHSPALAANKQHITSKLLRVNNCKTSFLWNTVLLISRSKHVLFDLFFLVKLNDINLHKLLKYK